MKNILFVLYTLPWPLDYGGNQAMFNGIAALKDVANIFIVYPEWEKDTKLKAREDMKRELGGNIQIFPFIEKRDVSSPRRFVKEVCRFLDYHTFINDKDCILDMELNFKQVPQGEIELVNKIIREKSIDIVQVEIITQLSIVNSLPDNVRKVFVHHELGFIRKQQLLNEMETNEYFHSLAECSKILEIGLLNKYDDIIVLSDIDKGKLEQAGVTKPIHTSFAIVKAPLEFKPQIDDYHTLCFIGAPKHRPNYLAVKWFLDNCWDQLLSIDKNYKLKIIGRWGKSEMKEIGDVYKNVIFTGFVDDLGKELQNGIMIVPITVGSGIRMKILEAASNGIPVVSTSIGAEGLPLVDGENSFVTDNPSQFVDDIIKLKDKALRLKYVENLNQVIRKKYSLEALTRNRQEILGLL